MYALNLIGERKINRVRSSILTDGLQEININISNVKIFITLKLITDDWEELEAQLNDDCEPETTELLKLLKIKYGEIYDYNSSWSLNKLKEICEKENLPIPDKNDF